MFKKQTFSSRWQKLDSSSDVRSRLNPKPIFIILALFRCTHALHISICFTCECMHNSKNLLSQCCADTRVHYTSRFSSHANARMKPKNHFVSNAQHAENHFPNLFCAGRIQARTDHPSNRGKCPFNTCPVLAPLKKRNRPEMVAFCKSGFFLL